MLQVAPSVMFRSGGKGKLLYAETGRADNIRLVLFCIASLLICSMVGQVGQQFRSRETSPIVDDSSDGDDEYCTTGGAEGDTRPRCDDLQLFTVWSSSDSGVAAQLGLDDILTSGDGVLGSPAGETDIDHLMERSAENAPPHATASKSMNDKWSGTAGTNPEAIEHLQGEGDKVPASIGSNANNIGLKSNGMALAEDLSEHGSVSHSGNATVSAANATHATTAAEQENVTSVGNAPPEEWSAGIARLIEDMKAKRRNRTLAHQALNERIARHIAKFHATLAAALPPQNNSLAGNGLAPHETAWGHELAALQQKLEKRSRELKDMHERHSGIHHVHVPPVEPMSAATNVTSGLPVGSHPDTAGHLHAEAQLATDIDRWHAVRREAATLATSLATVNEAHGGAWQNMSNVAHDFVNLQAELEQKLRERHAAHAEALRRIRESHSGHLRGHAVPSATKDGIRSYHELDWTGAASWKKTRGTGSNASSGALDPSGGVAKVSRSDLYGSRWKGKAPKVACITLVPRGARGKAWMRYFIDNFQLQHYEGERQLYLIHSQGDRATKRLVDKYVDGVTIKSGTPKDEEMPSMVGYRYGVFLAMADGADVIARWDFGGWYHPARLSTQIHSLALTSRPVSVLGSWTFSDGVDDHRREASDGRHNDGTIVGVASWMRRYWYPRTDGSLAGLDERFLVKVEAAAELAVYDDE